MSAPRSREGLPTPPTSFAAAAAKASMPPIKALTSSRPVRPPNLIFPIALRLTMRDAAASVVFPTARGHYCRFAHPDARALLSNLFVFSLSRITRPRRTLAFPRDSPRASPAALALFGAGPRANSRCLARARPACAGSARAVAGAAVTAAATTYVPAPHAHAYPAAGARSRRHRRVRLEPPRRRAASRAGEADFAQEARVAPSLVRDRHRAQAIPREHDPAPAGSCCYGSRSGREARRARRGG